MEPLLFCGFLQKTAFLYAILLFVQVRHALPCHHFLHHRIQESLCPHQGPTHPPRSQTTWHPGLPSCGGHCSCPVLAAALPHIAHPFPEYTQPRFLWMEYYCRFFSVREPHRQHKRQKYTNGYGCNDSSFHKLPPVLFFSYLLFA